MVIKRIHLSYVLSSVFLIATLFISSVFIPKTLVNAATVEVIAEEMLTVKVTVPTTWASGASNANGTFLRNLVSLAITTNNATGFTATMTSTDTGTALINQTDSSYTIPSLTSNVTRTNFLTSTNVNHWGYSINDTSGGSGSSTYRPIAPLGATSPSYIANSAYSSSTTTKDVYFGAYANTSKASGTYAKTVVFNVVSGVNASDGSTNTSGVTPSNPVTPSTDTNTTDTTPTYNSSLNRTVYTRTSTNTSNNTATTGTVVTPGNTTNATYSSPAGVTRTVASVDEGTPLATGLAVTAGVAATSGLIFFIVAKRRRDDDEEEEEY